LIARGSAPQRVGATHRITLDDLVDAGEAMLLEMVKLARAASRERQSKSLAPLFAGRGLG
jgi:pyroglutamyl-peptidase